MPRVLASPQHVCDNAPRFDRLKTPIQPAFMGSEKLHYDSSNNTAHCHRARHRPHYLVLVCLVLVFEWCAAIKQNFNFSIDSPLP